ncbi:MAG: hypothetical protein DRH57_01745 [Candidatus Cloacimonadota bacterium]|nr:MAG: hypothetical protein DRH57_01745 [Candidatus Cloacimonadota bacterium]
MARISVEASHKSSIGYSPYKVRRKKPKVMELNITSLIDVLTILLIFLLNSFSSDPQISTSSDIKLPYTTSTKGVKFAVNISISPEWILVDFNPVIRTREALNSDYTVIPKLENELQRKAKAQKRLATEKRKFTGNVILQADKKIPFKLIRKIMYTCGITEYNNILLTLVSDPTPHY